MRFGSATAVVRLFVLASSVALGQGGAQGLFINNNSYQLVSEERITETNSNVTYRADLVNRGPFLPTVKATLTSLRFTVVAGKDFLNFGPVPANSSTPSSNTFTILVDRSVPFSFADLQLTFQTTTAPPVANAGPNQTAHVGSNVTLDGSGSTNPSGTGTLSYLWVITMRPGGSSAKLSNANSMMPTFLVDAPGNYVITLTVSNGTDSSSSSVSVSTINTPPVSNAGANQTVALGSTVALNGNLSSDVDGDPLTYQWSLSSRPTGSTATLVGANTVSPKFVADKSGNYVAQLIVNDGAADSLPSSVTATTMDTAPVANAGPTQVVSAGALVQLNGAGSTDVDGDPLTYQWSLITVPSGSKAALSNPAAVNPTFTADVAGTYVAQLIANDGTLNSAPATVKITTNAILAPTANAGPNQTVGHKTTVTLSGSGTDPQSLPLTFQWTLTTKPAGSTATLAGASVATPTSFADLPGIYIAQLIVTNGFLSSAPSTVTVTTTNTPPVANAGPNQNVPAGSTVKLDGSGSKDADQDPLTYSWSFLSRPTGSGATLTAADTVSPVFAADLAGTYVLQLIVNDGFANSLTPSTVTITAAVNTAIALTPNPLNLSTAGPGTLTVTLQSVAGANGQVVNLASGNPSIASVPASVTIPSGSTGVNVTVTPGAVGSTTILATSSGFQPGNAAVNVAAAGIALTPTPINVAVTRTMDGTITLSGQAPTGGVTVNLTSSNPATATVTPSSILIPAGSTTASFTVTGAAVGSATIAAAATGYSGGSAAVNVGQLGKIVLPSSATVGPNQSLPYPVTLATPAPVGGVTITLASSDPSIVTVAPTSIFIDFKQTTPATQPTITGVNFGSASITASAGGVIGDTGQVQVAAALGFAAGTLNLNGTSTQNLTLTLAPSAPDGGLVVNLTSSNTGVATVPSSVSFPPKASTVNVPVTGVSGGLTTITATSSVPGIASATATVNVQTFGAIVLPANATVGLGQSAAFPVSLPSPAPSGGVTINLSSSDLSKVTIAPSSVTIPFNATVPATQPQINGVGVGSATITASAPNTSFSSASAPVTVTAALNFSGNITIAGTGTQNLTLTLSATTSTPLTINLSSDNAGVATVPATVTIPANGNSVTVPVTGVAAGSATITASASPNVASTTAKVTVTAVPVAATLSFPPGTLTIGGAATQNLTLTLSAAAPPSGLVVSLISSNPSVATVPSSVSFLPNANTVTVPVTGVTPGSTTITASSPNVTSASANVAVVNGLVLPTNATVEPGLSAPFPVSLGSPFGNDVFITLTSSDATKVALTSTGRNTISFIIPAGQTAPKVTPKVFGVDFGSATITATSFGFDTVSQQVQVTASLSFFPAGVNIDPGTTKNLTLALSSVPPTGLTVNLSSDNTGVATVPASVTFSAGVGTVSVPVTGVGTGSALIHASALPNVPDTAASVTVGTPGTPVSITTPSLASAFVGTPYSQTLTATGGMAPYTFSLISGTLPAGLTLNPSTGQISGTPTAAVVNAPVTFQVADSTAPPQTATAPFTLTISAPPGLAITTTSLANGSVSTPYSQTLTATGGKAPYTFALTSGTLPAGLTLNPATGLISGTPTASATNASLTFQATDSTTPTALTATKTLTITIGSGTVAITTTSLPEAVVNQPYNVTLNATGGTTPYTWSIVSGRLPSGFQLDPSTGQISGTTAGVFDGIFTVQYRVTDSSPTPQTATASLTIIVGTGVLKITNSSLANGQVNAPYSQTLTATGGTAPLTFSMLAGSPLPNGLTLNPATGEISGTPTAPVSSLRVSFQVKDSSTTNPQTDQANLTLTITTGPPAITTTSLAAGTVGSAYSANVSAAGGTLPYTFSATGLPAGLAMNASGQITGTPTGAGTSPVTLTVTDSTTPTGQTAMANLSITIVSTQPAITTASLPAGTVGSAYSAAVTAAGGTQPYNFSATGLPGGLSISASSGQITGTPTTAGTNPVTVTVTDSTNPTHQTATANLSITIGGPALIIATTTLPAGTQGTAYSASLSATGGTQPYNFSATGLPAGLTINASGQIAGTPTTAGTSQVAVTVTDSANPTHQTANANLSITIGTTLAVSTGSLPAGTQGTAYSATVSATGGTQPYTFSATGLPAGLSINAAGQITGTPTTAGASQVAVTVTDSANPTHQTASAILSITIAPPALSITTASLPGGTQGAAYSAQVSATGGTPPYTFSATGLPGGLSINASGQIAGTPTTAGTSQVAVIVTDSSNQTKTANFSVTIQPQVAGTPITVSSISIGQNLQALLTISIPQAPTSGSGGLAVTLASSDPNKLLLNSPQGPKPSITVTIPENQPSIGIFAQGLATGTATVTASATGFGGSGTVTVTPSGFVLSTQNGTPSLTTNQGGIANLTVAAARLDSAGNFVEQQAVRVGTNITVAVNLKSSNPSVGTITSSLTFTGGDTTMNAVFTASKTNSQSSASTTLTADVPAGFSSPAGGANSVTATVNAIGCTLPDVTAGRNLETAANVNLAGSAQASFPITVSSNNAGSLLLSTTPNGPGLAQITVTASGTRSLDFYVYGVGAPGNVGYTANAGSFGSCTGTVTIGQSGFEIAGPPGPGVNFQTGIGSSETITVSSVLLDSSLNPVLKQNIAGGLTVNVNVASSDQSVGTITSSPVTFTDGHGEATAQFQPTGKPGSSTLSVATPVTPAGFSTPAHFTTVTATVQQPAIVLGQCNQAIGYHLQVSCSLTLSQSPASDLTLTLSTTSDQLLISSDAKLAGSKSIPVVIKADATGTTVYLQALASSGTAAFTAAAPGYKSDSATAVLAPAGLLLLAKDSSALTASVAAGPVPVTVFLAQLDPNTNRFASQQPLAGGMTLATSLSTDDPSIGTVTSPTITGGSLTVDAQFTPKSAGTTVISITTPPPNFTQADYNRVTATVTEP